MNLKMFSGGFQQATETSASNKILIVFSIKVLVMASEERPDFGGRPDRRCVSATTALSATAFVVGLGLTFELLSGINAAQNERGNLWRKSLFRGLQFEALPPTFRPGIPKGNETEMLHNDVVYRMNEIPPAGVEWIQKTVHKGLDCEKEKNSIVVRCCLRSCAGFGDRVRGIPALMLLAKKLDRKVCFTRDYFMAVLNDPSCDGNESYALLSGKGAALSTRISNKGQLPKQVSFGKQTTKFPESRLLNVRYIASNGPPGGPNFDVDGHPSSSDHGNAYRLGMAVLSYSGVIRDEMRSSRELIRAMAGVYSSKTFVSLHVRVAGSTFMVSHDRGRKLIPVDTTTGNDNDLSLAYPNMLLAVSRNLPRRTICRKPLYISSDSTIYVAELQRSLPKGLVSLSCCSKATHIDKVASQSRQHFVDQAAMIESETIFRTNGGFATAASYGRGWQKVPTLSLASIVPKGGVSKDSNLDIARQYFDSLLDKLECSPVARYQSLLQG